MQAPTRHFTREFKLQLCTAIRAGEIGRREAERTHRISGSLIQAWLHKFERGEYAADPAQLVADRHLSQIAELERMVGRLTVENDRLRAAARAAVGNDNQVAERGRRRPA